MILALIGLLAFPFLGAVVAFVLPRRAAEAAALTAAGASLICLMPALAGIVTEGPLRIAVGGWGAPLGIDLAVDGLSATMLLLTGVIGFLVSLYARHYLNGYETGKKGRARDLFWPIWLMLWGSLNALFLSADLFNLYVVLELIGLGAVGLVVLTGNKEVLSAGLRYLIVAMAGSLCYLMGVALLYGAYGTLDVYAIGAQLENGDLERGALILMTLGLLMKSAVFPMHFWLPPAHSSATAPVSALLSALVVKGSYYILLRLWFEVFPAAISPGFGGALGVLGALAILWGSLQALRQRRLKMLVAHSTVAQLGYLMFLFPLTAAVASEPGANGELSPWVLEASKGTVYHILAHALAKTAVFLVAGNLMLALNGSDRMEQLRGISERMPFAIVTLGLASVSLIGLPPSGGFVAKWLLLHAVIGLGQWWWAPVLLGGGLLSAGYLFRIFRRALLTDIEAPPLRPVPFALQLFAFIPALLSLLIGIFANDLLFVIPLGTPFSPENGGAP
ncbi:MAG: complex I subunit 5 family protein [Opitutales bacterium]